LHGLDVHLRLLLGDEAGVGRDHVGGEVEVAGDFLAQVVEVVEPKVAGGEEGKLVGNLSCLDEVCTLGDCAGGSYVGNCGDLDGCEGRYASGKLGEKVNHTKTKTL